MFTQISQSQLSQLHVFDFGTIATMFFGSRNASNIPLKFMLVTQNTSYKP